MYKVGDHCKRCDSPQPQLHPAVQEGGEVQPCPDEFHMPGWHPNFMKSKLGVKK